MDLVKLIYGGRFLAALGIDAKPNERASAKAEID